MSAAVFKPKVLPVLLVAAVIAACAEVEEDMIIMEPVMEEPGISAPAAPAVTPAARAGRGLPVRRGTVTAGDIDDTLNLAAFNRFVGRASRTHDLPALDLTAPIRFRLTGPGGGSAPGVTYTLRKPGADAPYYQGISGVDGRVLVFPEIHPGSVSGLTELRVFQGGREVVRRTIRAGDKEQQIALPEPGRWAPEFLDIVFVIDTSGSMGDEHAWLQREFAGLTRAMRRAAPGIDIRYGLVDYRSPGDDYVLRRYGFTRREARVARWIDRLDATGGLGGAEVADRALEAAVRMNWRRGRGERLIFMVGDEPPAPDLADEFLDAAAEAARRQVQVFTIGASDILGDMEFLMRQASVATGGRYAFLTDDSGVGRAHGEPDVACYQVTTLASLMARILASELSGNRVEAPPEEVIRTVGTYRAGVCLQ